MSRGPGTSLLILLCVMGGLLLWGSPAAGQAGDYGVFLAPAGTGPGDPAGPAALGLADSMREMGLVHQVVTVGSRDDFFQAMRRLAAAGRKVDVLVIAGHGARGDPGISFGEGSDGGLGPSDLDVRTLRAEIQDLKRGQKRQQALGTGAAVDDQIRQARTRIRDIKALGEALNPGARILLINCDTTSSARGAEFVDQLGYALLPHGGRVIASRVRTAVTDQRGWSWLLQRLGTLARDLLSGKSGYEAGGHILSGDFEFFDFGPRRLYLSVDVSEEEIEPGQSVTLTAEMEDGRGPRHLLWTHARSGRTWQDRDSIQATLHEPGGHEFHVEAWDDLSPRPDAAQDFASVEVVSVEARIDHPAEVGVGEAVTLTAITQGFQQPWHEWATSDGPLPGGEASATTAFQTPGLKTVSLRVYDWKNPRKARTVTATLQVKASRPPGDTSASQGGPGSLVGDWIQENVATGSTRTVTLGYEQGALYFESGHYRCKATGSGNAWVFTFPLRTVEDFGFIYWHGNPPPTEVVQEAAGRNLRLVWRMTVVSPNEMRGTLEGIYLDWEDTRLTQARNGHGPFETVWRRAPTLRGK